MATDVANVSDEQHALLRAVLERPEEDLVRLVYADWLDEQDGTGDAHRARYIRWQLAPDTPPRNVPLSVLATLESIVGPLPHTYGYNVAPRRGESHVGYESGWEFKFRRGLAEEVRCPLPLFLAHARDLFAAHPITAVVISDVRPGRYGDRYRLYPKDADAAAAVDNCPYPIWRRIEGVVWLSEAAADSALSAACTAYGRRAAGLPPLE